MNMILKNLYLLVTKERMIFILVVICALVSTLIIHFAYGINYHFNSVRKSDNYNLIEINIEFNNNHEKGIYVSKQALLDCLNQISEKTNKEIDGCFSRITHLDKEGFETIISLSFFMENGIAVFYKQLEQNLREGGNMAKGRFFTEDEYRNGENVVVAGEVHLSSFEQETIELLGKTYEIIGINKFSMNYVPINSLDDNQMLDYISIYFDKPMKSSQYTEIKNVFETTFGDLATVPEKELKDADDIEFYNTMIVLSVFISLVAAINFAILYKYLIIKQRKKIGVFMLCGCTKHRAGFYYLTECMAIIIPAYILSAIFYNVVLLTPLSSKYEFIRDAFGLKMNLLVSGVYVVVSLIVIWSMIWMELYKETLISLKARNANDF